MAKLRSNVVMMPETVIIITLLHSDFQKLAYLGVYDAVETQTAAGWPSNESLIEIKTITITLCIYHL